MAGIDGLNAGDPMTAEQMNALFGCGMHPLAELRLQQLEGPDQTESDLLAVARLRAPYRVLEHGVSPFGVEVAKRPFDRARVGSLRAYATHHPVQ